MTRFLDEHDRTHMCAELRAEHIDDVVTLSGCVDGKRDLGGMVFIDLRDRDGVVQVRVDPDAGEVYEEADEVRNEWCIAIRGVVESRGENVNEDMPLGFVEIGATDLDVFS